MVNTPDLCSLLKCAFPQTRLCHGGRPRTLHRYLLRLYSVVSSDKMKLRRRIRYPTTGVCFRPGTLELLTFLPNGVFPVGLPSKGLKYSATMQFLIDVSME
jgi:hypothetical protein